VIICENRHRTVAVVESLSLRCLRIVALLALTLACACEKKTPDRGAPAVSKEPPITLAIITNLEGVLTPCGCTARSVGGVARLARVISELRAQGPLLVVVAGNTFFEPGAPPSESRASERARAAQARLKADALAAVLRTVRVDVIAPGPDDVAHAKAQLAALARGSEASLVHADELGIEGLRASGSHVLRGSGEQRVGLLGAVGERQFEYAALLRKQGARLVIAFAEDGGGPASPADLLVLHGTRSDVASTQIGRTVVVSAGRRAQEFSIVRVWPNAASDGLRLTAGARPPAPGSATVQQHALDGWVAPLPAVERLVTQVFTRIQDLHEAQASHDSESPPVLDGYVGARTCAACHTGAYYWWTTTRHARAYRTLEANGRALDLDCIGCHVTGFEAPGGANLGHLDELRGVGCESCHGPGGLHVDNPRDTRSAIRRSVPSAVCTACHDGDHSDHFDYGKRSQQLVTPAHGMRGAR
jgi:hypothetical protein